MAYKAPRYGRVTREIKVSLQTVCKLGTIAHNTDFSPRDFAEYTGSPTYVLNVLMRRGIVKRVSPGRYYPTPKGWNAIERSCRIKYGSR